MADARANILVNLKGAKQAQTQMQRLGMTVKNNIASFVSLGAAAAVLIKIGKDLTEIASKAEGVERAFRNLNRPNLLSQLRAATSHTISDFELMKQAVRAENFNIPLSQLSTLLEFAQKRARQTGESVEYLADSIIMGIGRKSPMILDNLGISIIRVREEFKKTGDMAAAVANIANEALAKMGDTGAKTADSIDQLSTSWENLKLTVSKFFSSGPLSGIVKWFTEISDGVNVLLKAVGNTENPRAGISTLGKNIDDIKEKSKELAIVWGQEINPIMLEYANTVERARKINDKFDDTAGEAADEIINKYKSIVDSFSSVWSQALLNQWNEGQNFFDNMVRGFKQMLAAMIAELAGKAAIFGIFKMLGLPIGGGMFSGGITSWAGDIFGSNMTTGSNLAMSGGGSTTNVNLIVQGNLIGQKDYVRNQVIPLIQDAVRKGYA